MRQIDKCIQRLIDEYKKQLSRPNPKWPPDVQKALIGIHENLFDLNPYFQFDGYWIVTDLLGIANLRQRTHEAISYIIKKLRGQAITKIPYLFKINNREKYVFISYVILSNLFFGYYILYRMPVFLYNFGKTVPDDLQLLFSSYSTETPFNFDLLGSLLVQLAFILLSFYILIKISVRIRRYTTDKIL